MKVLFAVLFSCILLPEQGMAQAPAAKIGVCEHEAQQVANYIEQLSWGKVKGYTPHTVKATNDEPRTFTYYVKVGNDKGDSASGYEYQIDVTQDDRSEACIITNVSTDGTDQAE